MIDKVKDVSPCDMVMLRPGVWLCVRCNNAIAVRPVQSQRPPCCAEMVDDVFDAESQKGTTKS